METIGDGNCLFYSVAKALLGDSSDRKDTATQLRFQVSSAILTPGSPLVDYLEDNVTPEQYALTIADTNMWGGEQELTLFAHHFGVRLHVYHFNRSGHTLVLFPVSRFVYLICSI